MTFSRNLFDLIPWLILHMIGTQYFQRHNQKLIPIFHSLLPLIYLYRILTLRPVILLLAQPLVIFGAAELTRKSWAVWGVAFGIILCNDTSVIGAFKKWSFEESDWFVVYITHVTMFWINSRSVSFCLDYIWNEIPVDLRESRLVKFTKMTAFCFYLPNGIGGPLINYKDYYEGVSIQSFFQNSN